MMKFICIAFTVALVFIQPVDGRAQSKSERGYDYKAHRHVNNQAKRWSHHRMKGCKGDMLNLKCTARQSRRYARKQGN